MKKSLASIFAFVALAFSVAANAVPVYKFSQPSVSGYPGGAVTLNVELDSGDISLGAEFEVGFDGAKLVLKNVVESDPNSFYVIWDPQVARILLINSLGSSVAGSSLFSASFAITDPYPSQLPDDTFVDISFFDELGDDVGVAPIRATVTVLERTVPEPGVLALTGLALLIMTVVGRRRRANLG